MPQLVSQITCFPPCQGCGRHLPPIEEEAISKAQQFKLIYSQSGYLYMVLPDAPRPMPFGQDKPGMSHSVDGLIGTTTHHNSHLQQPPMYGTPQYLSAYGGPPYYPPPPYQQPYPVALLHPSVDHHRHPQYAQQPNQVLVPPLPLLTP
jgi:hypothetical protein